MTLVDYPSGADTTIAYNLIDQPTQMVDSTGTTNWSYDGYGRAPKMPFAKGPIKGAKPSPGSAPLPGKPTLHPDQQGKHQPGRSEFKNPSLDPNRGHLTHSDPQRLLNEKAGTGRRIIDKSGRPTNRESVEFDEVIGTAVNSAGKRVPTRRGIIHYDERGNAHIVPVLR